MSLRNNFFYEEYKEAPYDNECFLLFKILLIQVNSVDAQVCAEGRGYFDDGDVVERNKAGVMLKRDQLRCEKLVDKSRFKCVL